MSGPFLAAVAAAIAVVTGAVWLRLMTRGRIPKDLTAFLAANVASAFLGAGALLLGTGLAGGMEGDRTNAETVAGRESAPPRVRTY